MMFDPDDRPRVFGLPPGVEFARALVRGLDDRLTDAPPEALARVELFVNTRRMQRRLHELYRERGATLLPRVRLISDLGRDTMVPGLPPAVSPLRRRLELSQLVGELLDRRPDLAPRASLYDLADSLAALMDEMQGEGVTPDDIAALDVSDLSGHWARNLEFVSIVAQFFGSSSTEPPDAEARQRAAIEHLTAVWANEPPQHPVIVAGSTGSRGATALFMQAVAQLPQGALVLPGFDFDLPEAVWSGLGDRLSGEDHPQFRFASLMRVLGLNRADIDLWIDDAPPNSARNRLISLALRPAPVTDQWLHEASRFDRAQVAVATQDLTLVEADAPRDEAVAVALCLRKALEDGQSAALITPDRTLTRQVTAALDRWGIVPDDSAGEPLTLSPPGRFLRHLAEMIATRLTAPALLTLLKHPLCSSGGDGRGDHLRFTREMELGLLRRGVPFPEAEDITEWAASFDGDAPRARWASWLKETLLRPKVDAFSPFGSHLSNHITTAEALARGPDKGDGAGGLWDKAAGRECLRVVESMQREAAHAGPLSAPDYRDLFHSVLATSQVREVQSPHPGIRIWGTLEARVQGADLVILAGLNDGVWPDFAPPDPWLNRAMRNQAGLLLPERHIGLAAHDFQQAVAARRVVLSRAVRDAEAETIASRWLNRLTNLLGGLSSGEAALDAMRARGQVWKDRAALLDARPPQRAATRPSPRPPVKTRPRRLSVTRIARLVRDPYAIYAEKILRLSPLDPLALIPDARQRGTILHRTLERFISEHGAQTRDAARARLMHIADQEMTNSAPWPAIRALWLARLDRVADRFLDDEDERTAWGANIANEARGALAVSPEFTLTATADRIDRAADATLAIYDYKSGDAPAPKDRENFDKQLLLEAVIAEAGFGEIPPARVSRLAYIGMGLNAKFKPETPEPETISATLADLRRLIAAYNDPGQGYTARRIETNAGFDGDFDHLARLGEWSLGDLPEPEDVG